MLASTFGGLATLLAGIGLYGLLAYSAAQRTREIGIRMALRGAAVDGRTAYLREVLGLAGIGIAVTIPISMGATRAPGGRLFHVSPTDAGVYAIDIVVIVMAAALAAGHPGAESSLG